MAAAENNVAPQHPKLLGHMVYFTLKDRSQKSVQTLIDGCKKHLTGHPGTVFFAVGSRNPDLARPVNDLEFDVGLQVVFDSKASHDAYQSSQRHVQFVEENQASWSKARVFDTDATC
jgi:hypothetical protein